MIAHVNESNLLKWTESDVYGTNPYLTNVPLFYDKDNKENKSILTTNAHIQREQQKSNRIKQEGKKEQIYFTNSIEKRRDRKSPRNTFNFQTQADERKKQRLHKKEGEAGKDTHTKKKKKLETHRVV